MRNWEATVANRRAAGVLVRTAELLEEAPAGRGGALWRLAAEARQLDANVVRLPPGAGVGEQAEPDLDVLLYVTDGTGRIDADGDAQDLRPGSLVWLPRGSRRALAAGPDGLVYLSAHRRRPGMAIRPARAESEGGEPACLLHRLCPACDRPAAESDAAFCARCGTPLHSS
jgi:quercetin dioxygenase-like cupin family protein